MLPNNICFIQIPNSPNWAKTAYRKLWNIWVPLSLDGLILIPVWISNYSHYKAYDENRYSFSNINGYTVEETLELNRNLLPSHVRLNDIVLTHHVPWHQLVNMYMDNCN